MPIPAATPPPSHAPDFIDGAVRREIVRPRQVYVNRNLRFDKVDLVGFDMDHTLAVYHKRRSEELAYELTLARLVAERGYPPDIGSARYDPAFVIRGLVIDTEHGHILKADRHNHVGRAYHGRTELARETRRQLYRHEKVRLGSERYAWIDTLFALPEACLYADIVSLLEARGEPVDFRRLYDDIRATIDAVHRDGTLKAELKKDLGRYIVRDPDLGPTLHKLRSSGKKLFVATNSYWDYTSPVMSYLLDGVLPEYPRWQSYFDFVIVGTQKPDFFSESNPFLEIDEQGEILGEATSLDRGRVYQGGNLRDLERFTGIGGERVLYVGDHIYGDILRSKKHSLWRTCMIVEELEDEIGYTTRRAEDIQRLDELERRLDELDDELNSQKQVIALLERQLDRGAPQSVPERDELAEHMRRAKQELDRVRRTRRQLEAEHEHLEMDLDAGNNPYWGFVFKQGRENSRFGEQVETYACLYTSRVSNLLYYSPAQYFRSPREIMPHERF